MCYEKIKETIKRNKALSILINKQRIKRNKDKKGITAQQIMHSVQHIR